VAGEQIKERPGKNLGVRGGARYPCPLRMWRFIATLSRLSGFAITI